MDINLDNLNQEQKKAVTHGEGPLLIVAGAGTGKTTVITQRINWLIREKKIHPNEILALTFTEKAAGEMEERVDKALPYGFVDLWVSTFHSFAEKILKTHAIDIGLPHEFQVINQTQAWLLLQKNLAELELDYYKPLGNPTKFLHALLSHFSRCKDEEVYPSDYLQYAEELKMNMDEMESSGGKGKSKKIVLEDKDILSQEINRLNEIANAYHFYQQLLLNNNYLDFGDLINYSLKLFKERPQILKKYQQQFKYIMIDEFQDTNWSQYKLIKLLAKPNNNITVVGDDDQSIYKFRGASVSNILNFKKDFQSTKEIFLHINYRNAQNILDLSYDFIQLNNPDRLEVKLASKDKKLSKQLKSFDNKQGEVKYDFLSSLDQEVEFVVNIIFKLKKENNLTWDNFAILVRANDSASDFVRSLTEKQIPYQFMASQGLYQRPLILDIINYLRVLNDYSDNPALFRVLSMPFLQIDTKQLININYWAKRKSKSIFKVLENIATLPEVDPNTVNKVNQLLRWFEKHLNLARSKPINLVALQFLEDSKLSEYINSLSAVEKQENYNYLNQFYKVLREFSKNNTNNKIGDWLLELDMKLIAGETGSMQWDIEQGPEAVKIMTIHAAKGLEFEYVFIPNLVDKRFPTISRSEPILIPDELVKDVLPEGDVHLQEERRLMYVAMTRARQNLYLTGAKDYGGAREKKPSRFIDEMKLNKQIVNKKPETITISNTNVKSKKVDYQLPKSFSYSQLKSFESCPLQYYYAYLVKLPVKGKYTFSFGSTIHRTLQKFFEYVEELSGSQQADLFSKNDDNKEFPSQDDLLNLYNETWIDDWYLDAKQMAEYKEKGKIALQKFYQEWEKDKVIPEFLEKGFKLTISDHTIRGVIDRADKNKEGLEIIDYKTGQSKTKLDTKTKEQLLIYQLALTKAGEKVDKLTYYYIEGGSKLSFIGKQAELDKTQKNIESTIQKIAASDFKPTPNPAVCKNCDFNKICEFSKAK